MAKKTGRRSAEAPRLGFNAGLVVLACTLFTLALGVYPSRFLVLSYQSIVSLLR